METASPRHSRLSRFLPFVDRLEPRRPDGSWSPGLGSVRVERDRFKRDSDPAGYRRGPARLAATRSRTCSGRSRTRRTI